RRSGKAEFRNLVLRVTKELEQQAGGQQARWEELMWYIHALVYHEREEAEELTEQIRQSVSAAYQTEVQAMWKSAAQRLIEEGQVKGALQSKQETLVFQLKERFKKEVPDEILAEIRATEDINKLDTWLKEVLHARTLAKMSFAANH